MYGVDRRQLSQRRCQLWVVTKWTYFMQIKITKFLHSCCWRQTMEFLFWEKQQCDRQRLRRPWFYPKDCSELWKEIPGKFWKSTNWRERDGLCLRFDCWICRKQTGTPVINSRNQRYMAQPSVTPFDCILLQRCAPDPAISSLLCCLDVLCSYTRLVAGGKLRHSYCRNGFIVAAD